MDRTTQGILDVARSVLAELDLDVVLERVLESAQDLTEARYAALGVLNDSRTELARFLTKGIDERARATIGSLPRGRGVLGALIEDPVPLRIADVGEHAFSYGFPHGHPPMKTFLGVPILVAGEPFGNLYLTEKVGGEQFTEDDEQAVMVLAEFAGVAVDHARRFTGASERRDELERTVAALEATTQIARAVGGETDPEVVLELVAKRGRALVSARALAIELVQGDALVIAAAAGDLPVELIGRRLTASDSVAGHSMRTRRAQRLEEQLNRARFEEHGLGHFGVQATCGLAVPLVFRGQTYGVLFALDRLREGPAFTAEDERLLEAFATSAATAVATARSVVAEHQRQRLAAAEGERRRWARELHDETLQSLSALRIGLSAAGRSERPAAVTQAVAQAIAQLEEAIANLRALITDLRPAALDELGVGAAVEALAERSGRNGIDVDVSVELADAQGPQPSRLGSEVETALYRIVQEALTNAHKHGKATRAVVEIHEQHGVVQLSVRDDGVGFDPQARSDGFGLLGMHERVALLDGELLLESSPGNGTVVKVRIPTRARSGEDASAWSQALGAGGDARR
ncbi:MAG TPA: GAF domain-containing sensor histidine kinase [Solirubrobacteraceae bacterium]|nr:GAF domain-containing sensor histidine kinase [Solirubrobacteraceae bacterium]